MHVGTAKGPHLVPGRVWPFKASNPEVRRTAETTAGGWLAAETRRHSAATQISDDSCTAAALDCTESPGGLAETRRHGFALQIPAGAEASTGGVENRYDA